MTTPEIYPDRSKAPATGDFSARTLPCTDDRRLNNGILRRCLHRADYELVRIDIVCPTGTMEFMPSVATLRGRMLKEGSRLYSGAAIAEILDFNGASVAAVPSNHNTVVSLTALRRNIRNVLPVFFDLLLHPIFPEKETEALKRQMIVELQCNRETPGYNAGNELRRLMAGDGHRFAMSDSVEQISAITTDILHNSHLPLVNPVEITAFIAGYADAGLLETIDGYLQDITGADHCPTSDIHVFSPRAAGEHKVQVDDSLQDAVITGIPLDSGITSAADYWPLRLAVHALGGYFGSRLMQNIREDKGYTYGIYAQLNTMPEGSFVSVNCECDPKYTPAVLSEISRELVRFANEPMGEDEYHRLHQSLTSLLAGMCDTPMKVQAQMISQLINGQGQDYYDRFWQAVGQVSPEQMSQVVGRYLSTDTLRTVIAGDFKK